MSFNSKIIWGEFKDGKIHGNGKFTWKSGAVYDGNKIQILSVSFNWKIIWGEWNNGVKHGKGKYRFSNGYLLTGIKIQIILFVEI